MRSYVGLGAELLFCYSSIQYETFLIPVLSGPTHDDGAAVSSY